MDSFVTINNIYPVVKPFSYDLFMVLFALLCLIIMIAIYPQYKVRIKRLNYILLTLFVVFNSIFCVYFIERIPQEISKYAGLDYNSAVANLDTPDLYAFYDLINSKLNTRAKYSFNTPQDPYYQNVKTKFKLAYYLLPRQLTNDNNDLDSFIVVDYKKNGDFKLVIPPNKLPQVIPYSPHLFLVKLFDTKKASKYGINTTKSGK